MCIYINICTHSIMISIVIRSSSIISSSIIVVVSSITITMYIYVYICIYLYVYMINVMGIEHHWFIYLSKLVLVFTIVQNTSKSCPTCTYIDIVPMLVCLDLTKMWCPLLIAHPYYTCATFGVHW